MSPRPDKLGKGLPQTTGEDLEEMLQAYQLLSADDPFRPQRLLTIAELVETLGRDSQALELYQQAYRLARSTQDERASAEALAGSARLYESRQEYKAALECYFECLGLQRNTRCPTEAGNIWMKIGGVYSLLGEFSLALNCFEQGMAKFSEGHNLYLEIKALTNVANALRTKGDYAVALAAALRSLMVFEELGDRRSITETLALIGTIHEQMGESTSALSYIERALSMLEAEANPALRGALLLSLSHLHFSTGHYKESLDAIEPALAIAQKMREKQLCFQLHEVASATYESIGNLGQALRHHRTFVRLQNEYFRHNRQQYKSIAELQLYFNLGEAERESERYRDQVRSLEREVYEKTRDMTTMSLDMVEKEAFLGEMKRQLSDIENSSQEHSASAVKLLIEDIAVTIKKDGGTAWRRFEEQFNEVHHEYLNTLTELYPSLTLAELKVCALTRLSISTKEIAEMLFVSIRNVQNHRYRIRKEFKLDSKANLTSFLMGLQHEAL